jgi:DMSO/TMAO reductase YedYZ heme-binding membrane subunit
MIAAVHGPSPLWYVTRGTGAVTLIVLTASVVLGIAQTRDWRIGGVSLFAVGSLHRTLSLFAVSLLLVHIVTTLLDPFPHIAVLAAAVPFVDPYRTLWLGLGTLAADLLIALVVTSLVRRRLGYGTWRGIHWFAYACWPVALLHGLGTGSDGRTSWMLFLTIACVGAVALALAGRLAGGDIEPRIRVAATVTAAVAVPAFAIWLAQGPRAKGWAARAGTPASVLSAFHPSRPVVPARTRPVRAARPDPFARPFRADLRGTIRRGQGSDGLDVVDLSMHSTSGPSGVLRIRLGGQATGDGGLVMSRSAVSFGPPSASGRYRGRVSELNGSVLRALVGTSAGQAMDLHVSLALNGSDVTGALKAVPMEAR